jgi:outer membrane protein TolC
MFPQVTFTAGLGPSLTATRVRGRDVDTTEGSYEGIGVDDLSVVFLGELQVLQPLYTFGKISERRRATAFELAARRAQTDMTRAEVAFEVAQLYEGMLFARDSARFLEESERWVEHSIEHTRAEIERETSVTEDDLLRFQAAQGFVKLAFSQAEAGQAQAEAGLVAYLGFPRGTSLAPEESTLEPLPFSSAQKHALFALALKQRPELRALQAGTNAYRALADAEAAGSWPDVFALGFVNAAYTPGRDWAQSRFVVDPLNHFVPGALLGVRWTFTGSMAEDRAAERQAQASELFQTQRWVEAALPAEVTKALEDVRRARRDLLSSEITLKHTKRWLVRASADYSVGLGDARTVSEAATAALQLQLANYEARYRHNVALAALAKATGTLTSQGRFYPTR